MASRAAFLGRGLDDIDAANFALALGDFDPARHRPHPPGAPTFVAAAKVAHFLVAEPHRALGWLSAVAQGLVVLPLVVLLRGAGWSPARAAAAAALALLNPVVWINGARPMSDSFGWLLVTAAQALAVRAMKDDTPPVDAAVAAGLAAGSRVQALALTLPLLALAAWRVRRGRGWVILAFAASCLAWIGALVVEAGGPAAYARAFAGTAADAAPVEPLIARPNPYRVWRALLEVLVRPWGSDALGAAMLLLAVAGAIVVWRRNRPGAVILATAFVPYLAAHALFQQVSTLRYAIPYVPLIAALAVAAVAAAAGRAGTRSRLVAGGALGALMAACVAGAWPALRGYRDSAVPALAAVRGAEDQVRSGGADLIGGHYAFRRFLELVPAATPRLAPVPLRELDQLGETWRRAPGTRIAFVAAPERTDLEAVDPRARTVRGAWQWPAATRALLSGERPSRAALVFLAPPAWFAGPGFLVSLEQGRVDEQRALAERRAWVRRGTGPSFVMLAGRPLADDAAAFTFDATLDGQPIASGACAQPLLAGLPVAGPDGEGYAELRVTTRRAGAPEGAPFALTGLAYGGSADPAWVHGDGWHWPETDRDARPFRWASGDARSLLHVPPAGGRLIVSGAVPTRRVGRGALVTLSVGGRSVERRVDQDFAFEVALDAGSPFVPVRLQSDREFVPDRVRATGDRRHLALRVREFRVEAP